MSIAYLNGEWGAITDAKVSVLDRGFLFGDGIYEVIPVYAGKLFTLARHLTRLANSLTEVDMDNPMSDEQWTSLLKEAVERSGENNAALYVQVTRGADSLRNHIYPDTLVPTVFVMVNAAPILERASVTPYSLITLDDFRWSMGQIKTVSLIAASMLKNKAIAAGANDAVLIRDGKVTECTASNIFAVVEGVLVTPPKSSHLLHGITRDLIVELALEHKLSFEEREISVEELNGASEVFITSSTHEAWPVSHLNNSPIGNGDPGVIWHHIDKLFQDFKKQV
jgi:D-alanine transaminase